MINEEEVKRIGERSDGRHRLNSSYSPEEFEMIDRLAMACGITPTRLQTEFMLLCLHNESTVNYIQDRFKRRARYRIIPSKTDGMMKYLLVEKKNRA